MTSLGICNLRLWRSCHSFAVQREQTISNLEAWLCAATTIQKMTDGGLAAWDECSQLLLRQAGADKFSGNFLDIHAAIITYVFKFFNTFVMLLFITIVI
jgi:hypothetical protein